MRPISEAKEIRSSDYNTQDELRERFVEAKLCRKQDYVGSKIMSTQIEDISPCDLIGFLLVLPLSV